jgi:Holliday junction resolvase RusA-like endonuclease
MLETILQFDVLALPGPQGSKRFVGTSKAGRGILVESSAKVKPWREAVVYAARQAVAQVSRPLLDTATGAVVQCVRPHDNMRAYPLPLEGPLGVSMVFTLPKPKSAPKRTRSWPDKKPDLSKLARSTEDALSDAGVWVDDARVVEYGRLAKVFPGEDVDALDVPGCRILIGRIVGT